MSGHSVTGLALRTSPPAVPSTFIRRPRVEALLRRAVTGAVGIAVETSDNDEAAATAATAAAGLAADVG